MRGLTGLTGLRGDEVAQEADRTDVTAIYIVIWLEHHLNRLYGVIGLLSKKCEWMDDGWWVTPLRLLRLLEHLRCQK